MSLEKNELALLHILNCEIEKSAKEMRSLSKDDKVKKAFLEGRIDGIVSIARQIGLSGDVGSPQ